MSERDSATEPREPNAVQMAFWLHACVWLERGWIVLVVYELAPVIATIIAAHCPGTRAREYFVRACVHGDWSEAACMIEGMLAEPWHLRGHQETRLREFLQLLDLNRVSVSSSYSH